MGTHARSTFEIRSWDEAAVREEGGSPKLARVSATTAYLGDVEGEGALEYLMTYGDDGIASFVGLERVTGRLGDRAGSFVLRQVGTFEAGTAKARCAVVPGSGSGGLVGLRGEGDLSAGPDGVSMTLDYEVG